ncbi:MAG: tetratricopeptide repeat protein [Bacteroidales bacterium]|nr:tetratricopeptide repeat protein [Bacteroidales bacterium]
MTHRFASLTIIAVLLSAVLLSACKSNNKLNRGVAALTTRYNVYFNGQEAYRQSLKTMEESTDKDDYSQRLKLHPVYYLVDAKPASTFNGAIEKCKKAAQTKSISEPPKRKPKKMTPQYKEWLKHGEFNPYMHNVWLLSGRSQFYNGDFDAAEATFHYVIRHFYWKQTAVDESHIWLSRIHALQGSRYEAESELGLVIPQKQYQNQDQLEKNSHYINMPRRLQRLFCLAQAEILLGQPETEKEALPYLNRARAGYQTKVQKQRCDFFSAQIMEDEGNYAAAYKTYGRISTRAKNYKTQFNARLAQVRVRARQAQGNNRIVNPKSLAKVESKLNRMRRQARNEDYQDQIYTALAEVALMQKDTAKAISNYELALEKSTRGGMDKAKAALSLGELTFGQGDYVRAQKAYSIAMSIIKDDYRGYAEIARLSSVLDELQTHAETVQLQDSLLHLSTLSEEELNKIIDHLIEELIRQEKEAKEAEDLAAYEERKSQQVDPLAQKQTAQPTVGQPDKSWYFYNPSSISQGKSEFQRLWGSRKPEDDWRRRNKTETMTFEMTAETETEDQTEEPAETEAEEPAEPAGNPEEKPETAAPAESPQYGDDEVSDPHQRAYYLVQIPRTDEEKANSHQLIEEGLYNEGKIINEKLENFPLAIHTFEEMEQRYPESVYRLETYYSIFLMYMRMGQKEKAEAYRRKLMNAFPESAYGIAVADPNYIENLRAMAAGQDSLYIGTYEAYLAGQTQQVHDTYYFVHDKWPLSNLMPKFLFLHALSYVQEGDKQSFQEALEQLTATYPESDVSPLASLMVKGIHEGRDVQSGEIARGMMWGASLRQTSDSADVEAQPFVADENVPHLLLLAFKTDSLNQNDLLFEVAKFNFENYLVRDFDLEIINTGGGLSVLVVSGFPNLHELEDYHERMDRSQTLLLPEGIVQIDISEPNFRALLGGRTFEDYFRWVEEQNPSEETARPEEDTPPNETF